MMLFDIYFYAVVGLSQILGLNQDMAQTFQGEVIFFL